MSQVPVDQKRHSQRPAFWLSGIGGFVLGALTVIIVLLLTRKAGDRDEAGQEASPTQQAVQHEEPPSGR